MVMGIPHPEHPFTMPHPTVYKIARAARKKLMANEFSADENLMFCRMKGLIVHSIV